MNLFDGKSGRSNGTASGQSSSIPSGVRSIAVSGEFGGATVTLMRYSPTSDSYFGTKAIWESPNVFQGLQIVADAKYLLQIDGAGTNTNIVAEI